MKQTITRSEYFQIVGLVTLAARYMELFNSVRESLVEVVGAEPGNGHCDDAVWDHQSADKLIDNLGITVEGGRPNALS